MQHGWRWAATPPQAAPPSRPPLEARRWWLAQLLPLLLHSATGRPHPLLASVGAVTKQWCALGWRGNSRPCMCEVLPLDRGGSATREEAVVRLQQPNAWPRCQHGTHRRALASLPPAGYGGRAWPTALPRHPQRAPACRLPAAHCTSAAPPPPHPGPGHNPPHPAPPQGLQFAAVGAAGHNATGRRGRRRAGGVWRCGLAQAGSCNPKNMYFQPIM